MPDNGERSFWSFGGFGWWLGHIVVLALSLWAGIRIGARLQEANPQRIE